MLDKIHYIFLINILVSLSITTRISVAQDVSWCEPTVLSTEGESSGSLFYPPLVTTIDSFGNMHLFWRERYEDETLAVMYARADQDGLDIVRDILPSENEIPVSAFIDEEGFIHLTLTVANDYFIQRTIHLADIDDARKWMESPTRYVPGAVEKLNDGTWYAVRKTLNQAYLSISMDEGASWSGERLMAAASRPGKLLTTDLAFDSDNRLHLVYSSTIDDIKEGGLGAGEELAYKFSDDFGVSWSEPAILDRTDERYSGDYGVLGQTLTIDSKDRLVLIWNGAPAGQRNYRISENRGQTWSPTIVLWLDYWRGVTGGHRLAEDSNGVLHLVTGGFSDIVSLGSGLRHATFNNNNWSSLTRVGSYNADAEAHQVVITNGNNLHAVFIDVLDTRHVFYACGTVNDAPSIPPKSIPPPPAMSNSPEPAAALPTAALPAPTPVPIPIVPMDSIPDTNPIASPIYLSLIPVLAIVLLSLIYFGVIRHRHH